VVRPRRRPILPRGARADNMRSLHRPPVAVQLGRRRLPGNLRLPMRFIAQVRGRYEE
jgi:hypothetical protein